MTATSIPPVAVVTPLPCSAGAEQLASAWLLQRAAEIRATYAQRGIDGGTALSIVSASGTPSQLTVTYRRVDSMAGVEQSPMQKTEVA